MIKVGKREAQIIAHKGGKYWTGKSFEYIQKSIDAGADIIELDIQWRFLKGYIVQHPVGFPGFDREIYYHCQGKLKKALKAINNQASVYLDIKDYRISPKRLIKKVRKYHSGLIIIGSFNWDYLNKFKEIKIKDKKIIINLHAPFPFKFYINKAREVGADWINPFPFMLKKEFAKEIQKQGFQFVPAGIDNFPLLKKYISWDAHAVSVYDINAFKKSLSSKK